MSRSRSNCSGSAVWILAMPPTNWMTSAMSVSARTRLGLLGPLEQRFTTGVQARPAGLEDVGVAVDVGQQLLGQCLLGGQVVHEPVEPGHQGLPGRLVGQVDGRPAQGVDLLDVDGLEQVLAGREVAVEGADPHPGPAGDVLQGGRLAVLGEGLPAGGDQLLVVPPGVGPLRAGGRAIRWRRRCWSLANSLRELQNGGYLRIVTGGNLHLLVEDPSTLSPARTSPNGSSTP